MLFGAGEKMSMFSTHPPMNERIARIDRSFNPDDLVQLAKNIQRKERLAAEEKTSSKKKAARGGAAGMFDADNLVDQIGNPDFSRILMAAALAASIPEDISRAAHSNQWATEVLFYSLMDREVEVRERQLLAVATHMGSDSESKVRGLLDAAPELAREQRLPLLEIAIPELKRRPPDHVKRVLATVKALSEADGMTDVFEYLMAKIIAQHLWESVNPQSVKMSGRKSIQQVTDKAVKVIAVLALHGNKSDEEIKQAFRSGCECLEVDANTAMPQVDDWADILDSTLAALDRLKPADKSKLVKALIATVMADNRIAVAEMELLRVVCSVIHVPLPMISGGEADATA
jgi:hypothetical protein